MCNRRWRGMVTRVTGRSDRPAVKEREEIIDYRRVTLRKGMMIKIYSELFSTVVP